MKFVDIHTHRIVDDGSGVSIISVGVDQFQPHSLCSLSVHPWYLKAADEHSLIEEVSRLAVFPNVVAVGECGLDKLCDTDYNLQKRVFRQMITVSERVGKPMILHCVKAFDDLMQFKREMMPLQPWILHGYRGKPAQAQQLLKHGFYFSIGLKFNIETIKTLPLQSIFTETDDSEADIEEVYRLVAASLDISVVALTEIIEKNVENILKLKV